MIVRAYSPGADDRGRPGAMAFHAAFVAAGQAGRLSAHCPLDFAEDVLRDDWDASAVDRTLETGSWTPSRRPPTPARTPEALAIVRLLREQHRVLIETSEPIDSLFREAWTLFPGRTKRRMTFATLAYSLGNGFDVVALPKRPGSGVDPSYRVPVAEVAEPSPDVPRRRWFGVAAGVGAAVVGGLVASRWTGSAVPTAPPEGEIPGLTYAPPPPISGPARADDPDWIEPTVNLAEEFGVTPTDPGRALGAMARSLRYRGRWLDRAGLDALPRGDVGRSWHEHMLHFAADRPWPADADVAPMRRQLDLACWTFRVPPPPTAASPSEAVAALAGALRRRFLVEPHPKSGSVPALADYAEFLGRLPRARG